MQAAQATGDDVRNVPQRVLGDVETRELRSERRWTRIAIRRARHAICCAAAAAQDYGRHTRGSVWHVSGCIDLPGVGMKRCARYLRALGNDLAARGVHGELGDGGAARSLWRAA